MSNARVRITVVNDNSELIDLITGELMKAGFEATGVNLTRMGRDPSAPSALLKYFHPQIVVMDVLFPFEGNWRYVTEKLIKQNPELALIFTVTDVEGLKKIIGKLQSPYHLVKKPYYLSEIVRNVESIRLSLNKRPARHLQALMHINNMAKFFRG